MSRVINFEHANSPSSRPEDAAPMSTTEESEITLIVPVFEERDNIVPFIKEVKERLLHPHQILIIYDRPTDSTLTKKGEVLSFDDKIRFVQNVYGPGIINAFRTGFEAAETKYVVPIMADLSDTPDTINAMYQRINEGYDLVVASRYCKGGRKVGGPFIKYLLSMTANKTLHHLTGIPTHDMTNAFIMHKREILDRINLRSSGGFEITMEIIAKSFIMGAKICEVPTVNRDRAAGTSNFKILRWISKYMYWYWYILIYSVINRINAHYVRDSVRKT